jgi:uncharacterized membrane protein YgaE (UPF0421/DUF939 family)
VAQLFSLGCVAFMDWSHVFETFIGTALAFLFALVLQRHLMKEQQRFQERMQKEQQEFQMRVKAMENLQAQVDKMTDRHEVKRSAKSEP